MYLYQCMAINKVDIKLFAIKWKAILLNDINENGITNTGRLKIKRAKKNNVYQSF